VFLAAEAEEYQRTRNKQRGRPRKPADASVPGAQA